MMKKDCCVEAVEAVETPRDMPSRARLTPRDARQGNKFCIVNFQSASSDAETTISARARRGLLSCEKLVSS